MIPCHPVAFKLLWLREKGKHQKSFDKYLKNKKWSQLQFENCIETVSCQDVHCNK